MIYVEGPNPTTLRRRMEHHAPEVIPLAQALIDAIVFGRLGQDERVHRIQQHKVGANSFSLTVVDRPTYHFRSHDYRTVEVYDSFKHGERLARVSSPEEAEELIGRIVAGPLPVPSAA